MQFENTTSDWKDTIDTEWNNITMNINTRLKRQSATCILCPFMLSGVYADVPGITDNERQAVTWMYSNINIQPLIASILGSAGTPDVTATITLLEIINFVSSILGLSNTQHITIEGTINEILDENIEVILDETSNTILDKDKEKNMKIKPKEITFTPSESLDVVTNKLYVSPDGTLDYDSQNWDIGNVVDIDDGKVHVDLSVYCAGFDGVYDVGVVAVDDGGNESDIMMLSSVPLDFIAPSPISDLALVI